VGVCAILRKFPLRLCVGGEVSAVQVAPTTRTIATGAAITGAGTTGTIGIGLAGLSVAVPVEVVGIARVALQFRLGLSLTSKIATGFIHVGIRRGRRSSSMASR
jgi:hypothetical protein